MMRTVFVLVLTIGLAACGVTQGKKEGEALAERYFSAAARGDDVSVLAMYDAAFYGTTSRAQWQEQYGRIRAKLGKPQHHTLKNWRVTSTATTEGSGQFVELVYDVEYERGKGTESIGVFLPARSGTAGIRSHHFNSDDLLR